MAYHLCSSSSSSSLLHDRWLIFCSVNQSQKSRPGNFIHVYKPHYLFPSFKTSLHVSFVSLQDPVQQVTQVQSSPEGTNPEDPNGKSVSSSKSYVWVNPKSPRAARLWKKSQDARYRSLSKVAESLDSCDPNEDDVFAFLNGLGAKVSSERDAAIVVNNMVNPDVAQLAIKYFLHKVKPVKEVVLHNVTLKVFRKCRNFDGAVKFFEDMLERGVKPDNVTFSTIISCASVCDFPEKAVEWFEKMSSFGCVPDDVTYSAMIDAYWRAGNIDMALSLYDRARAEKWRINPIVFSTLIKMYGVSGNYDGCLTVFEEMKALGAKPDKVIYHTLLDAMGRARRPWQVKIIYNEMISNGFSPTWVTYSCLLKAYCRARYGRDALSIYREMKGKEMTLDIILYNILLAMCADIAFMDEAIEIFDDMKNSGTCKPDSRTFSSMICIYSCCGKVAEAEKMLNEMSEAGFEPTAYVLTSLMQCYGIARRTDDVVKTFHLLLDLDNSLDDRCYGCLLNVMTLTPLEELHKLTECVEKTNPKLSSVVRRVVEEQDGDGNLRNEALNLFNSIDVDVKKAFLNSLIDLSVNLNFIEKACQLLDLGLTLEIYTNLQSRSQTQWSLHLKSLSLGAAMTAFHIWINDLKMALVSGEELPPLFGIHAGHGKRRYSDKTLAVVLGSRLKYLNAPFHEAPDKIGWFLTTKIAMVSWLESRNSSEAVVATSI